MSLLSTGGDAVTVDGVVGDRPGRDALTGVNHLGGGRRRGGRGRRAEQAMVPDAEFRSYYGLAVLNGPVWEARDIAGYLFLGGLAGVSSVIGAGAQLTGRPVTARAAKVTAVGGAALSAVALIHDLGQPSRFYNMLRVFKPSSPMSVGSWLLAGFGPATGAAALSELSGIARPLGTAATAVSAVLGPAVAAYTAALICDTAVPAWHDGHRQMPYLFVASGASAAAGMALVAGPVVENAPARRLGAVAAMTEVAVARRMEHQMGMTGEPYRMGKAKKLMRAAELLTAGGGAVAVVFGGRRLAAVAAGAALLAGSACLRFAVFDAGMQSAADPRYTVIPQRARKDAAAAPTTTHA